MKGFKPVCSGGALDDWPRFRAGATDSRFSAAELQGSIWIHLCLITEMCW